MKKTFFSLVGAFFVAVLVISAPVIAQTPDGTTPANEGVCDGLKMSATPGLYGLCVAYCEAQDLDVVGDKETPNKKILEKYRAKMQVGVDSDMPCVKVPCPCWESTSLAPITSRAGSGDVLSCASTATTAQIRNTTNLQFATVDMGRQPPICRYTDTTVTPRISVRFDLNATEAQSCYDQILAACTSLQP